MSQTDYPEEYYQGYTTYKHTAPRPLPISPPTPFSVLMSISILALSLHEQETDK